MRAHSYVLSHRAAHTTVGIIVRTYGHTYKHTHIHRHTHTHVHVRAYTHVHAFVHTCMFVYVRIYSTHTYVRRRTCWIIKALLQHRPSTHGCLVTRTGVAISTSMECMWSVTSSGTCTQLSARIILLSSSISNKKTNRSNTYTEHSHYRISNIEYPENRGSWRQEAYFMSRLTSRDLSSMKLGFGGYVDYGV